MKITNQEVEAVRNHLKENNIHDYNCTCGGNPEIIVDRTAWGTAAVIIKCQICGDTSAMIGTDHIEALEGAINSWDSKQERKLQNLVVTA
jgi:hypothetical protein